MDASRTRSYGRLPIAIAGEEAAGRARSACVRPTPRSGALRAQGHLDTANLSANGIKVTRILLGGKHLQGRT